MSETRFGYAMWVVYGYAGWIFAAYVWDWWKNRPPRQQGAESEEHGDDGNTPAGMDDVTTPAAA